MEEKEWVDFKEVKQAVSMQMVLDRYKITGLKKVGDELRGPCPVHKGAASSRHFCVSLTKNAFKCFAANCKARGNILDFVAAMENCTVRDAALKLMKWFMTGESEPVPATEGKKYVKPLESHWQQVLQPITDELAQEIAELEGTVASLTGQIELKRKRLAALQEAVGL